MLNDNQDHTDYEDYKPRIGGLKIARPVEVKAQTTADAMSADLPVKGGKGGE